ncbi:MAG: hypothetical protein KAI29_10030, partial [Cyclobacteriaceae bacterium]|nr:hypothetical protein [Cyclobacteriaceae bacterium]
MKVSLKNIKYLFFVFLLNLSQISSYSQQSDSYSLLFTGNTSEGIQNDELLKKWKKASSDVENQAFLMLGNIYSPEDDEFSKELLKGSKSPLLFTSGEKEWAKGSSSGKEMIKHIENESQEEYKGNVYMPDAACPGPKEVVLSDHLVVILIDTYWWMHKHDRRYFKCGIESDGDILVLIEDAIRRHYPTKHVVIAGHHSF